MGITAMWIPRTHLSRLKEDIKTSLQFLSSPYKGFRQSQHHLSIAVLALTPCQDSVGYDIYDVYDLGEFDQKGSRATKYGTKEELSALVDEAHKHGIVSYIDAVLNHKFGADQTEKFPVREVDSNDRTQFTTDVYPIEVCDYYVSMASCAFADEIQNRAGRSSSSRAEETRYVLCNSASAFLNLKYLVQ